MTSTRIFIARHEDGSLSLGTPHGRFDLDPRLFPELTWVLRRCGAQVTYQASEDAKVDNVQALMNAWVCFDLLDGRVM